MQTIDIAWAAGFLEGEGSFGRYSRGNSCLRIRASQVELEPLERLQKLFGGHINSLPVRHPNGRIEKCQPISEWFLSGHRAAALMMTIYKFMSPRRQNKIKELLDHWKQFLPRSSLGGHRLYGNSANSRLRKQVD